MAFQVVMQPIRTRTGSGHTPTATYTLQNRTMEPCTTRFHAVVSRVSAYTHDYGPRGHLHYTRYKLHITWLGNVVHAWMLRLPKVVVIDYEFTSEYYHEVRKEC